MYLVAVAIYVTLANIVVRLGTRIKQSFMTYDRDIIDDDIPSFVHGWQYSIM
jgi:hypothetical protein